MYASQMPLRMSIKPPFKSALLIQNQVYLEVVNAVMDFANAKGHERSVIQACRLDDTRIVLRPDASKALGQGYEMVAEDLAQGRQTPSITERLKGASSNPTLKAMRLKLASGSLRRPTTQSLGELAPAVLAAQVKKGPPYLGRLLRQAGHTALGAKVSRAAVSSERFDLARLPSETELVVAMPSPAEWKDAKQFKLSVRHKDLIEAHWIPAEVIIEALLAGAPPVAYALLASPTTLEQVSCLDPSWKALHERVGLRALLPQGVQRRKPPPL